MSLFRRLIFVIAASLLIISYASASTYVPVDDETYDVLLRLEAEGVIEGGLLTTRPVSRNEIKRLIRAAEKSPLNKSPFIRRGIRSLKKRFIDDNGEPPYIKPLDEANIDYVYSDGDPQDLIYNNDGDTYERGNNFRFGVSSRAEHTLASLFVNPEVRISGSDQDIIMKRAYGVLSLSVLDIALGKDSQWWGPGYHGSILLSNNTVPLTMIKLGNSRPIVPPWIFGYLGPVRFTVFAARLEKERKIPEPYLWGMRFNFKPVRYIEIGITRTALLGGEGRDEDIDTWWKSFSGIGENESEVEAGDQRAGFDAKVTLPFKTQPVQVYIDAAGEDEAGNLPSKWAYIAGVYLPKIYKIERLDFRAEYATTHVGSKANVWYNHHLYETGYTYKGGIIGHHMGTDSEDIFFQLTYYLPGVNGMAKVVLDRERHNLSGGPQPAENEASIGVKFGLTDDLHMGGEYTFGVIKNADTLSIRDRKINIILLHLNYRF